MGRSTSELLLPSGIISAVPPTRVSQANIDLKKDPLASILEFKREGAVMGHIKGIPHFPIIFPTKQYFSEEDGTQIMVVPEYGKPIKYLDLPEKDCITFFGQILPSINEGKVLTFNESANVTMSTAQTLGTLHFHILDFPDNQSNPDNDVLTLSIIEPNSHGIDALLKWFYTRQQKNSSSLSDIYGVKVDNSRIEKTGFPSGGIVFSFGKDKDVNARELYDFIRRTLSSYRLLHDSLMSCIVDRIAYLATNDLKGEYAPPRLLPLHESDEMMEKYFFNKPGFPEEAKTFLIDLRNQIRSDQPNPDLVVSYTIAVLKEEDTYKVILDPHFYKKAGSLEVFGTTLKRTVDEKTPLAQRLARAKFLSDEIGINFV